MHKVLQNYQMHCGRLQTEYYCWGQSRVWSVERNSRHIQATMKRKCTFYILIDVDVSQLITINCFLDKRKKNTCLKDKHTSFNTEFQSNKVCVTCVVDHQCDLAVCFTRPVSNPRTAVSKTASEIQFPQTGLRKLLSNDLTQMSKQMYAV